MHFGSLESTQEARVALGYRLGQLLRFFRALSPNFPRASITRYTHAKHEQILDCKTRFRLNNICENDSFTAAPSEVLLLFFLLLFCYNNRERRKILSSCHVTQATGAFLRADQDQDQHQDQHQ